MLILIEQLCDNDVLALEVVIKVPGTDIHLIGNIHRSGVGLTLLVEQREAGMQYPVPGFH